MELLLLFTQKKFRNLFEVLVISSIFQFYFLKAENRITLIQSNQYGSKWRQAHFESPWYVRSKFKVSVPKKEIVFIEESKWIRAKLLGCSAPQ